jgi:hypothetical protein
MLTNRPLPRGGGFCFKMIFSEFTDTYLSCNYYTDQQLCGSLSPDVLDKGMGSYATLPEFDYGSCGSGNALCATRP